MEKKVKVLVTGSNGFIGKNLITQLKNINGYEVLECDTNTSLEVLDNYCKECEFVFHLAGVNRAEETEEFMQVNYGFTTTLIGLLRKHDNKSSILMSSSIQAELDNYYGKSKRAGEDYIKDYSAKNNVKAFIFRLPNVFGKWCRPNYNSVVATFCNNIARDLDITINNRDAVLKLVYIDDVVNSFIKCISNNCIKANDFCLVEQVYTQQLGEIADMLYFFRQSRQNLYVPNLLNNSFEKALYSTYLSYLPENTFAYDLKMNIDNRGSFTEFLKSSDKGQVSINISNPHITKGNHWHNSKNEKFLVVSGNGVIRFKKINEEKVIEYFVSGDKLQVVDIPCGYTHSIENLGENDMVTIMWANEIFDNAAPDTYFLEV